MNWPSDASCGQPRSSHITGRAASPHLQISARLKASVWVVVLLARVSVLKQEDHGPQVIMHPAGVMVSGSSCSMCRVSAVSAACRISKPKPDSISSPTMPRSSRAARWHKCTRWCPGCSSVLLSSSDRSFLCSCAPCKTQAALTLRTRRLHRTCRQPQSCRTPLHAAAKTLRPSSAPRAASACPLSSLGLFA